MKFQFSVRQLLALSTITAVVCGLLTLTGPDGFGLLLLLWLWFSGIATVFTAPVFLITRKRVTWYRWELLVLVLPFFTWAFLSMTNIRPKSLANLGEPLYFSFAIPLLATIRTIAAKWLPNRLCAAAFIAMSCAVAVATYFLVPFLPE